MPRPKNKLELLQAARVGYSAIDDLLRSLSREQLSAQFSFEHRDRSVRDVLGHLYHWHLLFLSWYKVGMAGGVPVKPAQGYTWKTTPQLNALIHQDCQSVSLATMRRNLKKTHERLIELMESQSNDELFSKWYPWTGSTTLGSYFVSATSAHYAWALKVLKRHSSCR